MAFHQWLQGDIRRLISSYIATNLALYLVRAIFESISLKMHVT